MAEQRAERTKAHTCKACGREFTTDEDEFNPICEMFCPICLAPSSYLLDPEE